MLTSPGFFFKDANLLQFFLGWVECILGKRRKCWLPALLFHLSFMHFSTKKGPYSPTSLNNIPSLVLQIFLYLAAFECNITSD